MILWSIIIVLLCLWLSLLIVYRQAIGHAWCEPVLKNPVFIIESDDWGPGPDSDGLCLEKLAELLQAHKDKAGNHPLVTLGIVLSMPDSSTMAEEGMREYRRISLDDARFQPTLEAIRDGERNGVFALQLHGMEHFWPASLMTIAATDDAIKDWLTQESLPDFEALPAHLQSRWVDCSKLPSTELNNNDISKAVSEETTAFQQIFEQPPRVVVPPTFIWTHVVERAWVDSGIRVIVTPGVKLTGRNKQGVPQPGGCIFNGQPALDGAVYLVRDVYFEPSRGHTASKLLDTVRSKFDLGRPALLETHRYNFSASEAAARNTFKELRALIVDVLRTFPDVRFMSTYALAEKYIDADRDFFVWRLSTRFAICVQRLLTISRLRKVTWISGLIIPLGLILWVFGSRSRLPKPVE